MFDEHILTKWDDYKTKGRVPAELSLRAAIEEGRNIWLKPDVRLAFCWLFSLPEVGSLWVRDTRISWNFSLITVGYGPDIVEICSWRSMRQMGKAWVKLWVAANPQRQQEAERLFEIFKFKHIHKIQGGLIKQERCPRVSAVVRAYEKDRLSRKLSERIENLDAIDLRDAQ